MADFSASEKTRYGRQILLPELGEAGQEKLRESSVLLIGGGGLGSPAALYLAAAGVGRITLVDPDVVELSNLHRQLLHDTSRLGEKKTDSARARLLAVNPEIEVRVVSERFTAANALDLARGHDLILDGSDNFPTRFAANDAAFFLKIPLVHGAIFQFEGQATVFAPHLGGPCYRCLLPEPPPPGSVPSCAEAGVIGVLPGIIGSLQAMEAIKLLAGLGTPPLGRLIHYRALTTSFRELKIKADPACPLCGVDPVIDKPVSYGQTCGVSQEITMEQLRGKLAAGENFTLIDVRERDEYDREHIPGSTLLPLSTWPAAAENLPKDGTYLIHCQKGMRSAKAVAFLQRNGFKNVTNIAGGMDDW